MRRLHGTPDEQPGRAEQHQRERNLAHHQCIPPRKNAAAPVRLKVSAVADLQACEQVPSGEVPRRAKPEQNRTQHAEPDRGEKHARARSGRVHQVDRCQPSHGTHQRAGAPVSGHLVPQDRADEAASELLKRIQVEKARLTKEGLLRKEKPLPPVADDKAPFAIPTSWIWARIGTVSLLTDYGTSVKSDHAENGVPVLMMGDIQGGR